MKHGKKLLAVIIAMIGLIGGFVGSKPVMAQARSAEDLGVFLFSPDDSHSEREIVITYLDGTKETIFVRDSYISGNQDGKASGSIRMEAANQQTISFEASDMKTVRDGDLADISLRGRITEYDNNGRVVDSYVTQFTDAKIPILSVRDIDSLSDPLFGETAVCIIVPIIIFDATTDDPDEQYIFSFTHYICHHDSSGD